MKIDQGIFAAVADSSQPCGADEIDRIPPSGRTGPGPTLKRTAHPLLEDGSFEWLRIEIRPVGIDTDRVFSGLGKRNSHGAYYVRGAILPTDWPTLPAEHLCRFRPAWIDDDSGRYV